MPTRLPRRTRTALTLTRIGLWAERITRGFWPLLSVCLLILGVLLLFSPDLWSVEVLWTAIAVAAAGLIYALHYAWRNFHRPGTGEAHARLDATLVNRPLKAIQDTPALGGDDPAALAVWQVHMDRMHAQASDAVAVSPDLRAAKYDPYALRYVACLFAMIGLMFGSIYSIREISLPAGGTVETGPSWEGWVQPPSYTGLPTIYLNDVIGQTLTVPQDSAVMLRLYGDFGAFKVDETVSARVEELGSIADPDQRFTVVQSGQITIAGTDGAHWMLEAEVDLPPQVDVAGDVITDGRGQFSQGFVAKDDYGVVRGRAWVDLNLAEVDRRHGLIVAPIERETLELQLPLTISGDRTNFEETLVEDLSKHVWAHLPVSIVFEVEDIRGQIGRSNALELALPARNFFDPVAKALIEQRRDILWTPQNMPRVAQVLRTISVMPDTVFRDQADARSLKAVIEQLEAMGVEDVAEQLWSLALEVEDGELADAAAALARAQDKLAEAIRNGASAEEIQRLMEELRDAQRDYMQEFAERNPPEEGSQQSQDGEQGERVTQDQLQEMMDRLQQLMEEGRMAEAQELLEEINRLMENLETSDSQEPQPGQSEGQQSMEGLAETLRDQQGLSDQTFQDLQNQGQPGQGDQQGEGDQQEQSLADRQEELRRELDRQRGNLPGAGTPGGQASRRALDDAGEAMDRAEQDLRDGDLSGALDNQSQALEALRQGMRDLGEALAEERQQGQGQTPEGREAQKQNQDQSGRDPLGREPGGNGPLGAGDDVLPQDELRRRSQDLLDEIRRRSGGLDRSDEERDYLRRLIDQF